jgi:CRP-like cAMP-binding protein
LLLPYGRLTLSPTLSSNGLGVTLCRHFPREKRHLWQLTFMSAFLWRLTLAGRAPSRSDEREQLAQRVLSDDRVPERQVTIQLVELRVGEIADAVGIAVRSAYRIMAELVEAGYLRRTHVGRRNH